MKIYAVGGSVRDELLGVQSKDLDFVCLAPSFDAMRAELIKQNATIYIEKPEYLTIRCNHPKFGAADFVLARKDGNYSDGRRPDNVEAGSLYEDISRRDATCNALARDMETGEIIDYFGGVLDIKYRIITAVGKAEDRIKEDSLRLLRYLRLAITKDMTVDIEIQECLSNPSLVKLLENVSEERIREELYKMFKHNTLRTLEMLYRFYLIADFVFSKNIWLKPTTEK